MNALRSHCRAADPDSHGPGLFSLLDSESHTNYGSVSMREKLKKNNRTNAWKLLLIVNLLHLKIKLKIGADPIVGTDGGKSLQTLHKLIFTKFKIHTAVM